MLRVEAPLTHTLSSVDIDSDRESSSPTWARAGRIPGPVKSEPVAALAVHVRVGCDPCLPGRWRFV